MTSRRDLAQRAAAAAPGVRFATRRSWTTDPGEPRRPLLGGHEPAVGLWHWSATEDEFNSQARAILLGFVHPLMARGLPYVIGFPFGSEVFTPRRLEFGGVRYLDVEDIGRLLGVSSTVDGPPRSAMPAVASGPSAACRPSPDGVRLDAAQRAAVEHAIGPARVLAPAGSGKTKTLVSRVVELVDRGVDPAGILLLAFNRKAAEQLEERLAALGIATTRRLGSLGQTDPPGRAAGSTGRRRADAVRERLRDARRRDGRAQARDAAAPTRGAARPSGVHCATFNAFGYRYQRQVLEARFTLDLEGAAQRALMKRAMEDSGVSLADLKPLRGSDPVGAFMGGLTRVRAALEPPEEVEVEIESTGEEPLVKVPFAATHATYTRAQAVTGCQSFDDQIYLAVADMLADPSHRTFIEGRFDHVLVDEFQDLNGAQLALVDILSRPNRDLFVVGDDDQLIYGWRHADPRGILEFHDRMPPRPWTTTYALLTNYRCSRAVVDTAARLIANNTVREPKDVRPRDGAHEGAVRFAGAPSWPERAGVICGFLRAEKAHLACDWRQLAVLCRYRSQQLIVALALDAEEIPRTPVLGCRLFAHPAARLLRAYIDLLETPEALPGDAVALLLNRPNRYLTNAVVEAVGAATRPWALVQEHAAREPAAGPRPLSLLVEQVEWLGAQLRAESRAEVRADLLAEAGAAPVAETPATETPADHQPLTAAEYVWAVVDEFGLDEHWDAEAAAEAGSARSQSERDAAGPLQVLDALLLLAETIPDPQGYLRAWDRLRADEEARAGMSDDTLAREEAEEDRVVIGTIHAAKGREYHAVVIPDYDCDVSRWEPTEVEEERRVVYVAVTRARDTALFTLDTSRAFVQPFLRELVEPPQPNERTTLEARLTGTADDDERRRLADRIAEIDVLFPELDQPEPPAHAAVASEQGRSA